MSELPNAAASTPLDRRFPTLGRRGWMVLALAVIGAGMALNWGWLTAIGAAPLILSLAPCAAMCALGLCMRGGSSACANKNAPASKPDISTD
ncbi:hypothetical protein [Limimaricola cinnabarinus]|uniref:hypothetical protein n=1 Tax=Limimaricola cinnabarinus TaxID=1125964 RepID=UPI002FE05AF0